MNPTSTPDWVSPPTARGRFVALAVSWSLFGSSTALLMALSGPL